MGYIKHSWLESDCAMSIKSTKGITKAN